MSRRRSRQVEIFNFSFLDVLACTIGLLIFIMVMVFILESGSPVADASVVLKKAEQRVGEINLRTQRDNRIADELEQQLAKIHPEVDPALRVRLAAAQAERDAARALYDQKVKGLADAQAALQAQLNADKQTQERQLADAKSRLSEAEQRMHDAEKKLADAVAEAAHGANVHFLPQGQAQQEGGNYQVLHVDCRADEVVLMRMGADGSAKEVGRSPKNSLGVDSEFAKQVALQQEQVNPLILFWVRPDGSDTFDAARSALPDNVEMGYEPADAGWRFIAENHGGNGSH